MSAREQMAATGEEGCSTGLPTIFFAYLLVLLRDQVVHHDHIMWLLFSAAAVGYAAIGAVMALGGWGLLLCAAHAPDSLFEDADEGGERPWLFEDEDGL